MTKVLTLLVGWIVDKILGDPLWLPHPIVWFGKWISFWEHRLNTGNSRFIKGAAFTTISICGLLLTSTFFIAYIKTHIEWLSMALESIIIFYCLAGTTLTREVKMVFEATDKGLDEGRKQVARIVGRNTEDLSQNEIHAAALETLAENLSDGVIAPLFWFTILGVPGMLTYKLINTFDSMIGYQNERYKEFGCWAAQVDDIANWFPARITALLMILVSRLPHKGTHTQLTLKKQLSFLLRYGPQHASPNSGWPEAALASVLNCRFGGPHYYFGEIFHKPYIGNTQKEFCAKDMEAACSINLYTEIVSVILSSIIIL